MRGRDKGVSCRTRLGMENKSRSGKEEKGFNHARTLKGLFSKSRRERKEGSLTGGGRENWVLKKRLSDHVISREGERGKSKSARDDDALRRGRTAKKSSRRDRGREITTRARHLGPFGPKKPRNVDAWTG